MKVKEKKTKQTSLRYGRNSYPSNTCCTIKEPIKGGREAILVTQVFRLERLAIVVGNIQAASGGLCEGDVTGQAYNLIPSFPDPVDQQFWMIVM